MYCAWMNDLRMIPNISKIRQQSTTVQFRITKGYYELIIAVIRRGTHQENHQTYGLIRMFM